MTATTELLDKAKQKLGLATDYKLAKYLHWRDSTIANYRTRGGSMDVEMVEEFSRKTGIPLAEVLHAAVIDRREMRKKRLAARTGPE